MFFEDIFFPKLLKCAPYCINIVSARIFFLFFFFFPFFFFFRFLNIFFVLFPSFLFPLSFKQWKMKAFPIQTFFTPQDRNW